MAQPDPTDAVGLVWAESPYELLVQWLHQWEKEACEDPMHSSIDLGNAGSIAHRLCEMAVAMQYSLFGGKAYGSPIKWRMHLAQECEYDDEPGRTYDIEGFAIESDTRFPDEWTPETISRLLGCSVSFANQRRVLIFDPVSF